MAARLYPSALTPSATHAPSYYAATVKEQVSTLPFDGPASCDVCVIGGGFAGISTALHLARRGVDVLLLEQSRIGWGASGRNGGQAHVGEVSAHDGRPHRLRVGFEQADGAVVEVRLAARKRARVRQFVDRAKRQGVRESHIEDRWK